MNTLIIYESEHHGNTKKLIDAIKAEFDLEISNAISLIAHLQDEETNKKDKDEKTKIDKNVISENRVYDYLGNKVMRFHPELSKIKREKAETFQSNHQKEKEQSSIYKLLEGYDRIGIASGIIYGDFYPTIRELVENYLPSRKEVFLIYTAGKPSNVQSKAIEKTIYARGSHIIGKYSCRGYATYGFKKHIGGISKNHPTTEEIQRAAEFYREL